MPHTLIHLVSEQTMQNLLPLLALEPKRVIQIRSCGERFRNAAERIEAATRAAGLHPVFEEIELPSGFPEVSDVSEAIGRALSQYPSAIINITGGTKLMSLGAFLGADLSGTPMLYCDSEQQRFISPRKAMLPTLPSYADITRRLNLKIVMAAHGVSPDQWRFDHAGKAQLAFGQKAFELRFGAHEAFEACQFSTRIREFFREGKGRVPSSSTRLRPLLERDLTQSISDPIPPEVHSFFRAASEGGYLESLPDGGWKLAAAPSNDSKTLRSHVERIANLLDGSWLELAVLNQVLRSSSFSSACWSVEPSKAKHDDSAGFGETDIVALSQPDGHLQLISCKTALSQPLEHLEAMRERSQHLGGRFARATLALLFPKPGQADKLRRWGHLLSVRVLFGEECLSFSID